MRFLKLIQALLNRFHKTTYTMVIQKKKMKEIIKIRVCEAEKKIQINLKKLRCSALCFSVYDQSFLWFYIYIKFSTTFSFQYVRFIGLAFRHISSKPKQIHITIEVQDRVCKTLQLAPTVHHISSVHIPPPPPFHLLQIIIHIVFLRLLSFLQIFPQKFCMHLSFPSRL